MVPNRRRLQFGLSGFLAAVTALSLWLGYEANAVHRRDITLRQFEERGAEVLYHPIGGNLGLVRFGDPDREPSLIRELMGDRSVMSIVFARQPSQNEAHAADDFPEADLLYYDDPADSKSGE